MAQTPPRSPNVETVPINAGISSSGAPYGGVVKDGKFVPNNVGERRRDVSGERIIRRSNYVHDRLHNLTGPQRLADELYSAAEKFRQDFERAQLSGSYARMDLFKTRAGKVEISDTVAMAKVRIDKAFDALGNGTNKDSLSQSCMWNVVGLGHTLEAWTALIRAGGQGMNPDKASGIFIASLERLALHYGLVDRNRLNAIGRNQAYSRGIRDCLEFVNVFAATATGPEKSAIGRFLAAAQKRFERFA